MSRPGVRVSLTLPCAWGVEKAGTALAPRPSLASVSYPQVSSYSEPVPASVPWKVLMGHVGRLADHRASHLSYTIHSGCWNRSGSHLLVRSAGITMMERRTELTTARCWETLNRCHRSSISP